MNIMRSFRNLRAGALIGILTATLSPSPITPHSILMLGFGVPTAIAGTIGNGSTCTSGGARPSYWTGTAFNSQYAHNLSVSISTDNSFYICDRTHGVSYWGMVLATGGTTCTPQDYGGTPFVQAGWLVGNKQGTVLNPQFFFEVQGRNSPYCDPGPSFVESVNYTNTYFTSIDTPAGVYPPQPRGYFDIQGPSGDPYCPCFQNIDWNSSAGYQYQVQAETHDLGTYWSGYSVDFSNILYGSDTLQHPTQPLNKWTVNDVGPGNPYAMYKQQWSGNNSFRVCDTRVLSNPCR